MNNKDGIVSYVLVCDVSDNGQLYYYTGYFSQLKLNNGGKIKDIFFPVNDTDYTLAVKLQFKDEAQTLCDNLNRISDTFKYHVEDHMYSSKPNN